MEEAMKERARHTSMNAHGTPGPFVAHEEQRPGDAPRITVRASTGMVLAELDNYNNAERRTLARQLAASANACAGVPVEVLEANASGGLPWRFSDQIDQRMLRADLVAALQPFVERCSSDETITITVRTADVALARAVLAKAGSAA